MNMTVSMTAVNQADRKDLLVMSICALQEEKERAYGVDWKRFGLVSSFFNVFRKFIRLRTLWASGWQPTTDEARLDTIIDLLNYLVLSAILHAELVPDAFDARKRAGLSPRATSFSTDERGFKLYAHTCIEWSSEEPRTLDVLVPEILRLGEETIERWLSRVADVANTLDTSGRHSGVDAFIAPIDPKERLENISVLINLCAEAAVRHGLAAPEEWAPFVARYGQGAH